MLMIRQKHFPAALLGLTMLAAACHPVDRSGEVPYAPTVRTAGHEQIADSFRLEGLVLLSPNSRVLERGFVLGNDTMEVELTAYDSADVFHAYTPELDSGRYYYAAYARNGVGTGWGDTLEITVP